MSDPDFLEIAEHFQLGMLDTERPHPKTTDLSRLANDDPEAAVELLWDVDRDAMAVLGRKIGEAAPLAAAIRRTLDRGGRVYLCGCGATGRLSISLEIFARQGLLDGASEDNVVGFMAGGDAALIRSIERFEDRPSFGERQLAELGFADGDLLIASTEGGETPFVIGATEAASDRSSEPPFFLYGNPDDILRKNVERSRRVIDDPGIRKINLATGPMALSGSTRMQASTALMAAIGFAMKHSRDPDRIEADFETWRRWAIGDCDWKFLADFVVAEAETYQEGGYVLYEPGEFGITVLTDTTERSPTFTLVPFERAGEEEPPSLCYLRLPGAKTSAEAWKSLLHRAPRPLEWGELNAVTGVVAIEKFDFSRNALESRKRRTPAAARHHAFRVSTVEDGRAIEWRFRDRSHRIPVPDGSDFLGRNLLLKMFLNAHSTLIMGRLGRYEDNLMTYVSATNFKLIDRAVRYTRLLLERHHGANPDYPTVAKRLLEVKESLGPDEPIVLKTVEAIAASE